MIKVERKAKIKHKESLQPLKILLKFNTHQVRNFGSFTFVHTVNCDETYGFFPSAFVHD